MADMPKTRESAMQDKISPLSTFISAFGVSSFAGLAALLRAGKNVNVISVCSATLNSGFFGLAIALIWYTKYQDNIYFLVGICVLAGLGGTTLIDFAIELAKKKGLSIFGISFDKDKKESENRDDSETKPDAK